MKKIRDKCPLLEAEFIEHYINSVKRSGKKVAGNLAALLLKILSNRSHFVLLYLVVAVVERMEAQDVNDDEMCDDYDMLDNSALEPAGPCTASESYDEPAAVQRDEFDDYFKSVQENMMLYNASAKVFARNMRTPSFSIYNGKRDNVNDCLSFQQFIQASESARRVQAWHEMITPRLQEAENRRDFDIHVYGTSILDEFGPHASAGSTTRFSNVVRRIPKTEVARYFLATLQLVSRIFICLFIFLFLFFIKVKLWIFINFI